ncbi:MAG: hypothetical protein FRX49_12410 [Trebouxia sp. A1-2]|nr:MAG: hypothetical protein FRX49_12410 [Trebouxia sp. A1-2]
MGRRSQAGKRGNCQRSARTSASGAGQQTDIAEPESIEAEEQLELFGAEASEDVDAEASIGNVGLGSDNILGVDHGDRNYAAREEKLRAPLFPGSRQTVGQYCTERLHPKEQHSVSDTAFDQQCRINHDLYLSEEYFCPDSFHEVKQVLADCYGVAAADVKAPKHRNYAVLLDDLQGKVVWVDASATSLQAPAGVVLARRYGCLTGNICKEVNQKWQAKSDSICVLDDDDGEVVIPPEEYMQHVFLYASGQSHPDLGSCGNKDMMFYVTAILSEASAFFDDNEVVTTKQGKPIRYGSIGKQPTAAIATDAWVTAGQATGQLPPQPPSQSVPMKKPHTNTVQAPQCKLKCSEAVQKGQGKNQQKGADVAGKHKSQPGTTKQVNTLHSAHARSNGTWNSDFPALEQPDLGIAIGLVVKQPLKLQSMFDEALAV